VDVEVLIISCFILKDVYLVCPVLLDFLFQAP